MNAQSSHPVDADARSEEERPARPERQQPLCSEQLLRGARMVEIAHNGEIYRLQATRLGKLILTK